MMDIGKQLDRLHVAETDLRYGRQSLRVDHLDDARARLYAVRDYVLKVIDEIEVEQVQRRADECVSTTRGGSSE